MTKEELRREKAKNLRYKKPVVKELNRHDIERNLEDMVEACDEVAYMMRDDIALESVYEDDEEELENFKMEFFSLSADVIQMHEDFQDIDIPELFDYFIVAGNAGRNPDIFGYDSYEGDYFGLEPYEHEWAESEARDRVLKLTKKELMENARHSFQIVIAYMGLKNRYESLKYAVDIIRGQNQQYLDALKGLDEMYEKASKVHFAEWARETGEFNELIDQLPQEVWLY